MLQRHENVPSWAMAISLAATGAGSAGVKETGRKPSWARICWRRSIDMGAVVKARWSDCARRWPRDPSMPTGPPGTVTVMDAPGGNVPVASKASVSGPLWTHVPGTAGLRVGNGLSADRAVVKWTLTAASRATLVAPGAGSVETTSRWTLPWAGVALAVLGLTLDTTRAVDAPTSRQAATTIATMIPVGRESRLRC